MIGVRERWHAARLWVRAVFARRAVDADMAREMATHIEMERDHLVRSGVAPDDALRRARLAFGATQRFAEEVRDERGTLTLDSLRQDVRYALRHFRRAPVLTTTIVMMLALGIGATSFLFSVIEHVAVRPPSGVPPDPALVRIHGLSASPERPKGWRYVPYAELQEYRAQRSVYSAVGAWFETDALITPSGTPYPVRRFVNFVTSDFFPALRVRPALGQLPGAFRDDGTDGYAGVVVSHRFWTRYLGAAADAIGKTMRVGGATVTIVGVAPAGFSGAGGTTSVPAWVWLPLPLAQAVTGHALATASANSAPAGVIGRLAPGVSRANAQSVSAAIGARANAAALAALPATASARTRERLQQTTTSTGVVRMRANNASPLGSRDTTLMVVVLGAISLLIFAIVCTNVSGLVLGRAVGRRREVGVRLSLGATRRRITRQLVTESVLLGGAGGAAGLVVLWIAFTVTRVYAPSEPITFGWWTVVATIPVALLAGVIFGLSPALHATRTSVGDALKAATPASAQSTRAHRQLVVAHIALSQPLLVGLGVIVSMMMGKSSARITEHVAERTAIVELHTPPHTNVRREAVLAQVRDALVNLPGVVGVADAVTWTSRDELEVPIAERTGAPMSDDAFRARIQPVGEGFFAVVGVPIIAGREFDRTDVSGAPPAAIVGSDLARELWGATNPIGRTLTRARGRFTYTVVGVIDAAAAGTSFTEGLARVYVATNQYGDGELNAPALFVRSSMPAEALIPALRDRIHAAVPNVPIHEVQTLAARYARDRREETIAGAIASGGGIVALVLGAIGMYAVIAFAVANRTREIGIRLALGAGRGRVVAEFARDGLKLSVIGSLIALPISAYAVGAFMGGLGIRGASTWGVALLISLLVVSVALVAAWIPARRAARVDPLVACRAE